MDTLKITSFFFCNNKNSSPGPDEIPNILLTNLPTRGRQYLLKLLNHIWESGSFPKAWNEAIVVPIAKPGKNPTIPDNYRPISLTNTTCKTMEKLINRRLRWILENNNVISPYQSGFRQMHSTTDQLINIEANICDGFITNQSTAMVALDLEKAYDMVCRQRLISKLKILGLQGNILIFIENFIKTRLIKVRTNNISSHPVEIQNGVPQGSVLSVTLFLIAINEAMNQITPPVKAFLFADDLTITCKGKNIRTIQKTLQLTLNKLYE